MLTIFIRTGLIPIYFKSPILSGWMMSSLKVNVLYKDYMIEAIRLKILEGISAEYIDFYLWWSILAEKLAVPLNMYIVTDITIGAKGQQCQISWTLYFIYYICPGLVWFYLVLKCRYLYILGLVRIVKVSYLLFLTGIHVLMACT